MDDETRAAFGRMDRYFELARLQHLELRADIAGLAGRVGNIEIRLEGVEQRLGGVEQRLDRVETRLDGMDQRLDGLEGRLDRVERRLDSLERRMDSLESSFQSLRDWVTTQLAELWVAIRQINARLERLEQQHDGAH